MKNQIPAYIIQQSADPHYVESILKEFSGKDEFVINLIPSVIHENKVTGFARTIKHILEDVVDDAVDYVLICQEYHRFTEHYAIDMLTGCIFKAQKMGADILCGGLTSFRSAMRVSEDLFWVEEFKGFPFTIIFRSYFKQILSADGDLPFTNRKFFIYPFISNTMFLPEQPEAITFRDNSKNYKINELTSNQIDVLEKISKFYEDSYDEGITRYNEGLFEEIVIPTYIINLPERSERLAHIKKQFEGREEFDIKIIEACKNPIGAVGLWESILKIVKIAIANDEDLIIICEDDHEFTSDYSKSFLIRNILEAHTQQAEMISGGICEFHKALPVGSNRAWVSTSFCTQFIILYKPVFEKILNASYDDTVTADAMLSHIIFNKMVLYPFISVQKPFGYSDVTKGNNENIEHFAKSFYRENTRLKRLFDANAAFKNSESH